MIKLPIFQVDAFTSRLFAGNPAAVVITESELGTATKQSIAAENNLSETAFVVPSGEDYQIRWFTPAVEVDLCGHATLAAAHVLFNHLSVGQNILTFSSRSGPLQVRQEGEVLYLNFPVDTVQTAEAEESLLKGLGVVPKELYIGRDDFLAIFDSEEIIRTLSPNMAYLAEVSARGIIVSSQGEEVDFVSRFFAPQVGIPEDPVTGSAHTTLTPYWSQKLRKKNLVARQISSRGGELLCRDLGERIEIGGQAVTYLEGEIAL